MQFDRRKSKSATVSLILLIAMTVSLIALPFVNAQEPLIMNVQTRVIIHSEVDIDLNGGPGPFQDVELWITYPGRPDFTYIGTYVTRSNGDLDVYDFDFNETGIFKLQWRLPAPAIDVSNIVDVECVAAIYKTVFPYIGAMPNPVGVNQECLLHMGITQQHPGGVGYGWEGLTVNVIRPDGTNETLGPKMTDSTGGTGILYVPAVAGNYTLQTIFPEQKDPTGLTLKTAQSPTLTLVVQEEPVQYYPAHPLPTEYWTRPIDPQQREWSQLAGNWLQNMENYYAPGNEGAPDTAHILWAKPLTTGGLVGEPQGTEGSYDGRPHSFEIGDAYEGKFGQRFIMAGKLYYQKWASGDQYDEFACVDLHTGEELWSRVFLNNLTISFCQLMYWDTYDYHGVYDYLWCMGNSDTRRMFGLSSSQGNPWCAFDPFTGDYQWCFYNMPSGDRRMGPKGEILIYTWSMGAGWVAQWNSSNVPSIYASTVYNSMGWGQWRAMGKKVDARAPIDRPTTPLGISGYNWNVSIAGRLGERSLPGSDLAIWPMDRVVGGTLTNSEVRLWGLSLESGQEGTLLFNETWNAPAEWVDDELTVSGFGGGWMAHSQESRVSVLWVKETRQHYGFSLETGKYLWGPTEPQYYLDSIEDTPQDVRNIAYDKLFSASVSGIVYCYDVQTGERLWSYEATDPYSEILWANTWWVKPVCIADGKIYVGHAEHSPIDPRPRGGPFICLNVTTGEEIFRINGAFRQTRWGGRGIIGDSIIATMDTYDQRIYAIGKGPSATTVTAGPEVSVHGSSVLVKGMVTDTSPGTDSFNLEKRFPNGVPAVSDANMSDWMLYVYKQFPRPADAVGVEVVVEVLDPNNNYYEVGRATSDATGFYSVAFTPEVPGKYTIIATFEGSGSYYGSSAETAINVEEAPAATPPPTPTPAPMTDTYVTAFGIGIIIAIVVVGLLLVLMLRRR